jgi:hypothetical protein
LHYPYESKSRVCEFFGNLAAFSERADSAFFHKRMMNRTCYLLGASNSVRSPEFLIKRSVCTFRLQLSLWHGLVAPPQPEAKWSLDSCQGGPMSHLL